MAERVLIAARDLFFRSKVGAVVTAMGAGIVTDDARCDMAVVELDGAGWEPRVRALVARGVPVLAYGSHVNADVLRAARDAGAVAVPNSQLAERLREMLAPGRNADHA